MGIKGCHKTPAKREHWEDSTIKGGVEGVGTHWGSGERAPSRGWRRHRARLGVRTGDGDGRQDTTPSIEIGVNTAPSAI